MAKLNDLIVTIGARTREFDKKLNQSMRQVRNFGRTTKRLGKDITMGVTAPIAALGFTAVKSFQQQAKAVAQMEAGLASTGSAVGYTSQQLQQMASDLQKTTLFGDEQILQDATAQLLTFTNISGEQFKRTQAAALDLATRLDGDLKSASIQLGKALNDPVANLSALSRSGIQFSDSQKEVIKSLAESGDLASAQTIILDELNKQYGGSAEAAAKADGGFTQLANSFGDLQEKFGEVLVEVLQPVIEYFRELIDRLNQASPRFTKIAVVASLVAAAIGPLLVIVPTLVQGFYAMRLAMISLNTTMLANPFVLVATGIALAVTGIIAFTDSTKDAATAMDDLKEANEGVTAAEKERNIVEAMAKQKELVAQLKAERDEKQKLVDQGYGGKAIKDAREAGEAYKAATQELNNMSNELFALDSEQRMKELAKDTEDVATAAERVVESFQLMGRAIDVAKEKQAKYKKAFEGVQEAIAPMVDSTDKRGLKMSGGAANTSLGFAPASDAIDTTSDEALNALDLLEARSQSVADAIKGSLTSAFSNLFTGLINGTQSFGEFMKKTLTDLLIKLASLAAAFAVINVLTGGAGSVGGMKLGQFLGSGLGLPMMADGGIVSGKTALIAGEYPGAKSNPEVIAPLDKLQGMLAGSGGDVRVYGQLSGKDILLSSERAGIDRNRVRGF